MDNREIELQALITQREAMLQIMNRLTSDETFKQYSEGLIKLAEKIRALKSEESAATTANSRYITTIDNIREILDMPFDIETKIASINIIIGAFDCFNPVEPV
jgi:hypothetical protein